MDWLVVERMICGFAAGPLPAHRRGTRRKYVLVRHQCRMMICGLAAGPLPAYHRGTRRKYVLVRHQCRMMICGLAAGPLPAHRRGTRRKYVHVGSYAASMPRKVPRRWAGKDQWRWSVCMFSSGSKLSGAVSSPIAGPCGGMDAATEPTWTYLRRVPRAARTPRTRPTKLLIAAKTAPRLKTSVLDLCTSFVNISALHSSTKASVPSIRGHRCSVPEA
ncbi:hypothetical protein CFBP7900_15280 [Xanthomonas hortorum pv. carotae]|uniref:Uncharacterized protein n=1 Tax=Xanthomonas hortorum pv. carotae TaxID=487904 RepID=A0A6V7CWV5_9XANT|nr:hypothetical protein CFBP7900_15280 [Xanthomonas hortorum pv. carotae]CAD0323942.1 hypothetical protein CFBP7900_15280 [Xanthomonas hortorum pv. carotae]